jgi:hypothetical protein
MQYDTQCELLCIDTNKTSTAEVDRFVEKSYVQCFIGGMSINLQYNLKYKKYIGGAAGLEFSTDGPKIY